MENFQEVSNKLFIRSTKLSLNSKIPILNRNSHRENLSEIK